MDKYAIVALVFIFCIGLIAYTQMGSQSLKAPKSFKDRVQQAFPNFKIIEKYNNIVICEMNHRNEPEELISIRLDANQQKNIRIYGRTMIATYPKEPSAREMKKDFAAHLNT